MKRSQRLKAGLVIEHLEGISRTAIKRYPEIITEFARGRSGVYALYKGKDLYYLADILADDDLSPDFETEG
jgi:hypothetical protein